jgi:hypothetical protein
MRSMRGMNPDEAIRLARLESQVAYLLLAPLACGFRPPHRRSPPPARPANDVGGHLLSS